jgi:hypothetical protein
MHWTAVLGTSSDFQICETVLGCRVTATPLCSSIIFITIKSTELSKMTKVRTQLLVYALAVYNFRAVVTKFLSLTHLKAAPGMPIRC